MDKRKKQHTAPRKLKLLVTIVNREKAEFYIDLLQDFEINLQAVMLGRGTASTETLQLLGIAETEKAVILSVVPEDRANEALSVLTDRFKKIKNGNGIAWTIPLSGTVGVTVYRLLSNTKEGADTKWNSTMK